MLPRRLTACAIAFAIVVVRFVASPAGPHRCERRSGAIATVAAGQRTPGRSARVEEGGERCAWVGAVGTMIETARVVVPDAPPAVRAPGFRATAWPETEARAVRGVARAPPGIV